MKTLKFISIALAGALLVLSACKKDNGNEPSPTPGPTPTDKVTDACGNTYPVVKIGDQYWMAENLKCNKYANQSEAYNASWLVNNTIPTSEREVFAPYYIDASDKSKWNKDLDYSQNLTHAQVAKLGYLYNWAATVGVADGQNQETAFSGNRQGICPNGWHVPSSNEWQTLVDYIEKTDGRGVDTAGKHLKTTSGWYDGDSSYKPGLDSYDFAALPAGEFGFDGPIEGVGYATIFWTATPHESESYFTTASFKTASYDADGLYDAYGGPKSIALSVRCVKD